MLAERRKQRAAVTPSRYSVRHVKFSPEEMAYDIPQDTSDWAPVGRGKRAIFAKPDPRMVKLATDVAKVFKNSQDVNKALRKLIEAMPAEGRRRKSA